MEVSELLGYADIITVGICLCAGYIMKCIVPKNSINNYIPLIVGLLGVCVAVWNFGAFNPHVVCTGLVSGMASTGMYEALRNTLGGLKDNG